MYADDDVLLLSASISGLQQMINTCCVFGDRHCIKFNTNKSCALNVGKTGISFLPLSFLLYSLSG